MTEMVERVARAIFQADQDIHGDLPERHYKVAIAQYTARALAAIEAVDVFLAIREINGTATLEELAKRDAIDEALK